MTSARDRKVPLKSDERLCSWCEHTYRPTSENTSGLCPDCRSDLLEQPKEVLVDMLGQVAGVNVITMASLALYAPDSLDALGLWNAPEREGFSRFPVTMKQLTRKHRRVQ